MKKVLIIGAGIAGLTCSIYLRRNGFETEMYELNHMPGGECTGWDRKEYHFDGCIHWLVGSKAGTELNELWRETGALNDGVEIINHEIFARYEEDGRGVNLYRNADRLERHLMEISLQDGAQIKKLCAAIRALGDFGMPIKKPMDMMGPGEGAAFAAKNAGKLMKLSRYGRLTMAEFAAKFKEPLLGRAFLAAIPGYYKASALVATLASMHGGDSGYPLGGSRAFARRMEQKYLDLGGKAFYNARVEKIVVKDGRATGLRLADGREISGDYVISCADAHATLFYMLEDRYTPDVFRNLFDHPESYPTPTSAMVFMGVGCEIKEDCASLTLRRKEPVLLCGRESEAVGLLNYGFDRTMAPPGKTVVACLYEADYDYWNGLDKEEYLAEKEQLKQDAARVLIGRYPEADGKIEATDAVTPLTYVRYCNAWRGSWMSWGESKDVPRYYPGILPGLDGFIMAGMWTLPPGGLPGAAASGRFAAHRLCAMEGLPFKTI